MNPPAIPLAKQIIRALTLDQAQAVDRAALEMGNPEAVQALVRERMPAAAVE
jgi:phosphoenolpyruvate-protein kinase (PTS system EI component)